MTKQCGVESCEDRAEEYCYHCSEDVCHRHFTEHKKWLRDQLMPMIKQVNGMFDRFQRADMDQTLFTLSSLSNARQQLDQWRSDCVRHIDDVYDRALQNITVSLDERKKDALGINKQNLDSLSQLRRRLGELLSEGDIAYGQIQSMKQQLHEIERKEQKLNNQPNIRVVTGTLDAENHVRIICERQQPERELDRERTTKVTLTNRNVVRISSSDESEEIPRLAKKPIALKKPVRVVQIPNARDTRTNAQPKRNNYRDRIAYANEHTRKKASS